MAILTKSEFFSSFPITIIDEISLMGKNVHYVVQDIVKVNQAYKSATFTEEGNNVGVNVNMNVYFNEYENGKTFAELVQSAKNTVLDALNNVPTVSVNDLCNYEIMKTKLIMALVSTADNESLLATVPHTEMADMSIIYRFYLDDMIGDDGQASVLVTNNLLQTMGVTLEQLHADALESAPRIKAMQISGMNEVIANMMGCSVEDLPMGVSEEEYMYVATTTDKVQGACVLAYPDFMETATEIARGSFFILPSSLHEVLIVPDDGQKSYRDLEAMVREVNATQVAPCDILTNSVYHYDVATKAFTRCE